MKKLALLGLLFMAGSSRAQFGTDTFFAAIDMLNVPIDYLLKFKNIPLVKEVLHEKKGQFKEHARYPKFLITAFAAYFAYKNEKVQNAAAKISKPIKRAIGVKERCTKKKK